MPADAKKSLDLAVKAVSKLTARSERLAKLEREKQALEAELAAEASAETAAEHAETPD